MPEELTPQQLRLERYRRKVDALYQAFGHKASFRRGNIHIQGPLMSFSDGTPLMLHMGTHLEVAQPEWLKPSQRRSFKRMRTTGMWLHVGGYSRYSNFSLDVSKRTQKEFNAIVEAVKAKAWAEGVKACLVINTVRKELEDDDIGKMTHRMLKAQLGSSMPPGLSLHLRSVFRKALKEPAHD